MLKQEIPIMLASDSGDTSGHDRDSSKTEENTFFVHLSELD